MTGIVMKFYILTAEDFWTMAKKTELHTVSEANISSQQNGGLKYTVEATLHATHCTLKPVPTLPR
jgi:hypothetical protein